jgi:hypothetical protein
MSVLMTKIFKLKIRKRENIRKIKDQVCLRHEKENRSVKEQKHRRLKSKGEVIKTRVSNLANRRVRIFLDKSNPIRDKNLVCFGKIFLCPCKRATSCC